MTAKTMASTIALLAVAAFWTVALLHRSDPAPAALRGCPLLDTESLQAGLEPGDTLVYTVTVTAQQTVMNATRGVVHRQRPR